MLAEFLKRSACQHIKIGCYSTTLLYSSPKYLIQKGKTCLFKVEKTSEMYVTQQQNIVSNDSSNYSGKKYFKFGSLLLSLYIRNILIYILLISRPYTYCSKLDKWIDRPILQTNSKTSSNYLCTLNEIWFEILGCQLSTYTIDKI